MRATRPRLQLHLPKLMVGRQQGSWVEQSCPAFGFGQEKPKVATETFHELTARMNSGEAVKFDMFKGKVLMVVNVATE